MARLCLDDSRIARGSLSRSELWGGRNRRSREEKWDTGEIEKIERAERDKAFVSHTLIYYILLPMVEQRARER